MQLSFLIVTKNRPEELQFTLRKIRDIYDEQQHEVLVYIDGCKETEAIQYQFDWVRFFVGEKSISASPARNFLYKKAKGEIYIGLDDDAHLISNNPIKTIQSYFQSNTNLGILAFLEIKGIFEKPENKLITMEKKEFLTTDFIGCGFAIRKKVYDKTNGFPLWMDIYGEEPSLSIEVMNLEYDILYTTQVAVNHRVDGKIRKLQGKNYFRFEKQLLNTLNYFLIYYPNPFKNILKAIFHNFKKYAMSDRKYFYLFCKSILQFLVHFLKIYKLRMPVSKEVILKKQSLQSLKY
jgi:glycosyltransferase involved in cell wall biosynthesis